MTAVAAIAGDGFRKFSGALGSLNAAPVLCLFAFLTISAGHLEVPFLVHLGIELLLVGALCAFYLPALIVGDKNSDTYGVARILTCCLLVMSAPLLSSMANGLRLEVLNNPEFRSWAKALLVVPLMPWLCRQARQRESLLDSILFGAAVFALIVFFRFYVLGEMREVDERPKLKVKNGDPNFICTIFAIAIPFALYKIQAALRSGRKLALAAYTVCLALFGACVFITESRMGLLSLTAGIAVLMVATPMAKRLKTLLLGAFLVVMATSLLAGRVGDRFKSMDDESNRERIKSLVTGAEMFIRRPAFGFGWGTSPKHFYEITGHGRLLSEARPLSVHNTFLQLLAEMGMMGFFAYLSLYLTVLVSILQVVRARGTIGRFCLASFVILSLNLTTLPLQGKDFILLYFGVLLTLALGATAERGAQA